MTVKGIIAELAEEAAFLHCLRNHAVNAPHSSLDDLARLDERLDAQIDGLRIAGEAAWAICKETFESDPEGIFAAAVLAFESSNENHIRDIMKAVGGDRVKARVLVAALGWLPYEQAKPHVQSFLTDQSPFFRYIGIAASAIHRHHPGLHLEKAIFDPSPLLKARALRAYGELGRSRDVNLSRLQDNFTSDDDGVRFYAAWSATLAGNSRGVEVLKAFAEPTSTYQEKALSTVMLRMEHAAALSWQKQLAQAAETVRLAVIGAAVIGDPVLLPWIIEQMKIPALARVAGDAFTMITGVDITLEEMQAAQPEEFEAGPNDDPNDDNVAMDVDDNLPWPDADQISAWWKKNRGDYPCGIRYRLGKPVSVEHLRQVLYTGHQRQRSVAALELAITNPDQPLFEVRAPAFRQYGLGHDDRGTSRETRPCTLGLSRNPVGRPLTLSKLVVTAANSMTAVGHDGLVTSASVRAGISRLSEYDAYLDRKDNPIIAAPIRGIDDDNGDAGTRLANFATTCLEVLLSGYFQHGPHSRSAVKLFLGVASQGRPGPRYDEGCLRQMFGLMNKWAIHPEVQIVRQGNVSMHFAFSQAAYWIERNPDGLCIVGGIDSLIRESTLNWFEHAGRLKSGSHGRHQGLIAGEAVAFMIIEGRTQAEQANRTALALINGLGLAEEPAPRASNSPSRSSGLTDACRAAFENGSGEEIRAVFGDLNGENSRAREWSMAEMRVFKEGNRQRRLWKPGDCYGDIGAASGVVLTNIVTQGYARQWLPSPVLVFCSDDHGACGALVLERPIIGGRS